VENIGLFGSFGWALGIDGIALMLIMLSVFLMPICVLSSWKAIEKRVPEYMAALLLTEGADDRRVRGAGSVPVLHLLRSRPDPDVSHHRHLGRRGPHLRELQILPLHVARLDADADRDAVDGEFRAHDSIPVLMTTISRRSADLAVPGLLRELRGEDADVAGPHLAARRARAGADGGFGHPGGRAAEDGRLRLHPLLAADVPGSLGPALLAGVALSSIAVVYTSLVALVQSDMKKLIAYSSVAHMAIVTFGLFAFNRQGIEGALMVMLGHGIVSGALFLCVGVVYDRLHTREIALWRRLDQHAALCRSCSCCSRWPRSACRALSNFVGEFLSALIGTTGIILGAAYMLYLYRRVAFGDLTKDDVKAMPDLDLREFAMLGALAAVTLWMGIYPESFMKPMRGDVEKLVARLERAAPAGDSLPTAGKPAPAVHHEAAPVAHGEAH
jgi:NADH-quinone oxidoreductase subunit M